LNPMARRRSNNRTLGSALIAAILIGSTTAWGVVPACTAATGIRPLQLSQRTATHLLMSEQRPAYPAIARINYIRGNVSVLLTVNCDGRVQQAHVVKGHPFLAIAALQAIKKWIYRPFVTPAGPAAFQTTVKVDFSLLSAGSKAFPPEPEKFLARGVKPPQPPKGVKVASGQATVSMRVLVNEKGRAVDSTLLSGTPSQFREARLTVAQWKFNPARWGNLKVPWYTDVVVPVEESSQPSPEARSKDVK
jgi:TonB family protein